MVFGQNLKIFTLAKKGIIGKGISRGAEWCKFEHRSSFQSVVIGAERFWLMRVVKVVTHECTVECGNAITVQRN